MTKNRKKKKGEEVRSTSLEGEGLQKKFEVISKIAKNIF